MEELKLSIGNGETVFRQGKALDPVPPVHNKFQGTIHAPATHYLQRKDWISPELVSVRVNYDKGIITLHENPRDQYADAITGSLQRHPFFVEIGVNTNKQWTAKGLLDFLRFKFEFFSNNIGYIEAQKKLSSVKAVVNSNSEQHNQRDGLIKNGFQSSVETDLKSFKLLLKAPLFVGEPAEIFEVELQFEPDGSSFVIYLMSMQIMEREKVLREELLEGGLAIFREYGVPILYFNN